MRRGNIATRVVLVGLCALALVAVRPVRAEDPLFEEKTLRGLTSATVKIARAGKAKLAAELLDTVAALGYPEAKAAKSRVACEKASRKPPRRGAARSLLRVAKDVRKGVTLLAQGLAGLAEADRTRAAGLILRLDDACEEAHRVLGHERIDGVWLTEEEKKRLPRRLGFCELLRLARAYPIEIKVDESVDPVVEIVTGRKGHRLKCDSFEIHSALPRARLERILRETARAALVVNWLLTGESRPPRMGFRSSVVMFKTGAHYRRALEEEARRNGVSPEQLEVFRRCSGANIRDRRDPTLYRNVCWERTEARATANLLVRWVAYSDLLSGRTFTSDYAQPSLMVGLLNLACLAYLGCELPTSAWFVRGSGSGGDSATERKPVPPAILELPRAGLAGTRKYISWLASENRDPPWVRTFRDHNGKITGDERIKTTSMVEFLSEHGPLLPFIKATSLDLAGAREIAQVLEAALRRPLPRFEESWRAWVLPGASSCIVRRLEGDDAGDKPLSPATKKALAYFDRQRARAGLDPVRFDPGLAEDARRHAVYLSKNPEQAAKWPDAHEEYPDRPGFSPEGSWAGLHSVIAQGESTEDAIDQWLGTFYHRLPLLEPGLLAIGWGACGRFTVLDAGSLVAPPKGEAEARWPPGEATGVPTRFCPELPNPVPGEDQSPWGYPVTLQLWSPSEHGMLDVRMTLHEGKRGGPAVPCHYSTPDHPTNPELAPAKAYCLIPKSHLRPGTKYVVVATIMAPSREIVWEFTTGR